MMTAMETRNMAMKTFFGYTWEVCVIEHVKWRIRQAKSSRDVDGHRNFLPDVLVWLLRAFTTLGIII